jgi:hypothetical protein
MAVEPRTATRSDIPVFARVIAEAFFDDPVFTWMFPDEEHRMRRVEGSVDLCAPLHVATERGVEAG